MAFNTSGHLQLVQHMPILYTSSSACPCAASQDTENNMPPDFVGHGYFCESGNKNATTTPDQFYSDTLWDGKNCFRDSECCAFSHPPYLLHNSF